MEFIYPAILFVEDSDEDYEMACDAIRSRTQLLNPIVRVKDGKEAIASIYDTPPFASSQGRASYGLILLDLNMAGIGGLAFFKTHTLERIFSRHTYHHIFGTLQSIDDQ